MKESFLKTVACADFRPAPRRGCAHHIGAFHITAMKQRSLALEGYQSSKPFPTKNGEEGIRSIR
ncbi:MAG TPA: hypothetical protein VGH29_08585, partial [Candidatus Binataceae bacterium]